MQSPNQILKQNVQVKDWVNIFSLHDINIFADPPNEICICVADLLWRLL